jgi:hypothetical protein
LSKDICWRGLRDHNKIILSPVILLGKLLFTVVWMLFQFHDNKVCHYGYEDL